MNLEELKKELEAKLTEKQYIQRDIKNLKIRKRKKEIILSNAQKALSFLQDTSLDTQKQLEFHINEMVSAGLNSVFEDNYGFVSEFVLKREKTECNLYFEKEGHLIDPFSYSGLGAADVAGFCLLAASLSMDKTCPPILILDEPFKHLDIDHHEAAGQLVRKISESLGIQIIMVTHSQMFTQYAHKVFKVKRKNGVSHVTET